MPTGGVVGIVEVAPRDGLQNESVVVPTAAKVELIGRAVAAGVRRIEAVSFVHPERVPQMADAEAVMAALPRVEGVSYIGLVLNGRGLQRALDTGCHEVNAVVAATDGFAERNQGMSSARTIDVAGEIVQGAREAGLSTSVTVSVAVRCPFEGPVPTARLVEVVEALVAADPDEIAIADTIGAAVPTEVVERLSAIAPVLEAHGIRARLHVHDTRGTAAANVVAALGVGVQVVDASLGGIGGCPFAPAATGNVATEDLAYLLSGMGAETGLDLDGLCDAVRWMESAALLGRPVPGRLSHTPPLW